MVKVIRKKVTFQGNDGKEHYNYNYYLQLDNGRIAIKNVFDKDDRILYFCSEEVQD